MSPSILTDRMPTVHCFLGLRSLAFSSRALGVKSRPIRHLYVTEDTETRVLQFFDVKFRTRPLRASLYLRIKAKITSNLFILISKRKVQPIHSHVLNMWMIFSKYYKFCTVKHIFSECIEFHLYIFFVKNSITNINSNISILFICCASIRVHK